jgi:hypothetical protein
MNERIKEMWEEATVSVWPRPGKFTAGEYDYHLAKFAELIVRECTHIIANQAWESRTAGANGDWTEYNTLSRVAGQIKEHFGVEE